MINLQWICLIDYGTEGQRTASITVTLIETGATTTTNSNSDFIFSNIPVGTYTLTFTFPGATPATKTNVVITKTQVNDTTDIGTITLIMGDPNGDGQINILDWPLLAECLGSPTAYNPNCDFNSDGVIALPTNNGLCKNCLSVGLPQSFNNLPQRTPRSQRNEKWKMKS